MLRRISFTVVIKLEVILNYLIVVYRLILLPAGGLDFSRNIVYQPCPEG